MMALFLFSKGIIEGMNLSDWFYWGFFIFVVAFSPIYFMIAAKMEKKDYDKAQVIFSVPAVIIWVASIGGPFAKIAGYNEGYALLILGLFTTILPLLDYAVSAYWPKNTLFAAHRQTPLKGQTSQQSSTTT